MISLATTGVGLAIAAFGFFGAIFSTRVLVNLLRTGPSAAEDAFARGDSIQAWLNAERPAQGGQPLETERYRFAGRRGAAHGDEMVEERASFPRYAK